MGAGVLLEHAALLAQVVLLSQAVLLEWRLTGVCDLTGVAFHWSGQFYWHRRFYGCGRFFLPALGAKKARMLFLALFLQRNCAQKIPPRAQKTCGLAARTA